MNKEPSDALAVQVASLRIVRRRGGRGRREFRGRARESSALLAPTAPGSLGHRVSKGFAGRMAAQFSSGLDLADRARLVHKIGVQLQDVGIPPRMKAGLLFAALYRTSIPLSELSSELGLDGSLSKQYGEATRQHRTRPCGRPEIVFGRTHYRPRPGVPLPILGLHQAAKRPRHDDNGDHPLLGGGAGIL